MASVSPSASPYGVPPTSAGSPPPTSASPPQPPPPSELPVAPVRSQLRASPTDSPSPSSAPPPSDVSSWPPSPVLPAPLPVATSSTHPPLLVPPSPPPSPPPPPPVPLTTPLYPLPPPPPKSSLPPPFTTPPPTKLSSSPVKVSPPPPFTTPPPTKLSSSPVKVSPPPPPPPPPPPDNPTSSPPPSKFTSPPTHFPSTPPPTAPPAHFPSTPPLPASPSPESPPSSTLPNVDSPTPASNSSETSSTAERNSGIGTASAMGIGIGIGVFILSFIGLVIFCSRRRRKKASKFINGHIIPTSISTSTASDSSVMKVPSSAPLIGSNSGSESYLTNEPLGGLGNSGLWFTYDDLEKATDGFSEENFLGEGGFGAVYKGRLHNGREVAVKQLKVGAKQGEREFRAEVDIISRIHHRYLVSLVGYCIADNRKLLVYDYVPNNTLYFHLHGEGKPVLDWATRVKIAAGAARGLAYLHEDCHPRIIHRDIKSSNLLLDDNFAARVSDFGLAKLTLDAHTHVTTRVMGTFGYMAPEYAISGKLTEKSDVYSFGVVLLELITGRKPVDTTQPLGDEGLVEWARPLLSHALDHEEFEHLADPRLEGSYVGSEMLRMVEAAAACVRHLASKRPRMGQIVRALDSFLESDLTNGMRLKQSEVFDSARQSLEIQAFRRMQFRSQDSSIKYFSQSMMTS